MVANQRHVTGQGDGLVLHFEGLEGASTGFDVGDVFLLVLDFPAGMPVGQVFGGQSVQFGNVLFQHGLGQVVDSLGHVFFSGGRGGRDIATEQAQKSNHQFRFFHGCFLVVVGDRVMNMKIIHQSSYNLACTEKKTNMARGNYRMS
ncbi:hypothetical protein D3C84_815930 [compost metagenome]